MRSNVLEIDNLNVFYGQGAIFFITSRCRSVQRKLFSFWD